MPGRYSQLGPQTMHRNVSGCRRLIRLVDNRSPECEPGLRLQKLLWRGSWIPDEAQGALSTDGYRHAACHGSCKHLEDPR